MNIGIVCYASVGGSGIVATELAKSLAERGHAVHVLSTGHTVPARELPAGSDVSSRAYTRVSAVPGTAIRDCAGQPYGPGGARAGARCHSRALRGAARNSRVSGQADPAAREEGCCPADHHDVARHGHHTGRERSFIRGDGRIFDRDVGWRDGGVRQPASGHVSRLVRTEANLRHSEFSRLRCLPADSRGAAP